MHGRDEGDVTSSRRCLSSFSRLYIATEVSSQVAGRMLDRLVFSMRYVEVEVEVEVGSVVNSFTGPNAATVIRYLRVCIHLCFPGCNTRGFIVDSAQS